MRKLSFRIINILGFFYSTLILSPLSAQHDMSQINARMIPPSPNAASLGKYGEVPVNLYRGLPEVNIPLYNVSSNELSLNISLNYLYDGLKVSEVPSWTGLGWTLMAGGVITKVVRGSDDDAPTGYNTVKMEGRFLGILDPISQPNEFNSLSSTLYSNKTKMRYLAEGRWDGVPDLYYFNFPGSSGKLIQTNNGFKAILYQNFVITKTGDSWMIVDEKGIKYYFGTLGSKTALEATSTEGSDGSNMQNDKFESYISAWHLLRIESPSGKVIDFEYADDGQGALISTENHSKTMYHLSYSGSSKCNTVVTPTSYYTLVSSFGKRLEKITFDQGEIIFKAINSRSDIGQNVKRLDAVQVFNKKEKIKEFIFDYEYLGTCPGSCRLLLSKVTEKGKDNKLLEPYVFSYNRQQSPPSFNSFRQDHWGYFNDNRSNTLVPKIQKNSAYNRFYLTGADRESSFMHGVTGALIKIDYPTKGSTSFFYEANDYGSVKDKLNSDYVTTLETPIVNQTVTGASSKLVVIEYAQDVEIRFRASNNGYPIAMGGSKVEIVQFGVTQPIFEKYASSNTSSITSEFRNLPPGRYLLKAEVEDNGFSAYIELRYNKIVYENEIPKIRKNEPAGGIRLSRTEDFDGFNLSKKLVKKFSYKRTGEPDRSSGVLIFEPNYEYSTKKVVVDQTSTTPGPGGTTSYIEAVCGCIARTSSSVSPLGSFDGSHVGYSEVTVYEGLQGENGSTYHKFSSAITYKDVEQAGPPFLPPYSNADKRGKVLEKIVFRSNLDTLLKVKNEYELNHLISSPNISAVGIVGASYSENSVYDDKDKFDYPKLTQTRSEWSYLKKSTEIEYVNNVPSLSQVTQYFYENPVHAQLTKTNINSSEGRKIGSIRLYPEDYSLGSMFIDNMKSSHILSPIEKLTYEADHNDQNLRILSGEIYKYDVGGRGLISEVYTIETDVPILLSSFRFSNQVNKNVLPHNGSQNPYLLNTDYYRSKTNLTYDLLQNLIKIKKVDEVNSSYVWGYNSSLVIAEVRNEKSLSIAFTSFETPDLGNWNTHVPNVPNARTGKGAYIGSLSKNISPGTYIVSCWASNGTPSLAGGTLINNYTKGGWTFYEWEIASSDLITINNNGSTLDDARLHPKGSEMTSYTYDPLIGITSITDTNNVTTFFQYDAFGRLASIKDQDGNITEKHEYHYIGQK